MKYFEDIAVGRIERYGHYAVEREEMLRFAAAYDPQPFHLDDEAAARTHFGRLSASGWHICAMTMRMMVDHFTQDALASLGSPGIDQLRWLTPVHPGDMLRVESELLAKRRSRSRREMGLTKARIRTFNRHDRPVLEMVTNAMVALRDPGAPMDDAVA